MRFAKQILPAVLTSLTVLAPAHADLFISRTAAEPEYLVQTCTLEPQVKCTSSAYLDQKDLRRVRREVRRTRVVHGVARASTIYLCEPVTFPAIVPLRVIDADLRALIRSPEGGLVRVRDTSPAARIITEIVSRNAHAKPAPVESAPTTHQMVSEAPGQTPRGRSNSPRRRG